MAKDSDFVKEAIKNKCTEDQILAWRYFTNTEKDGCLTKWNRVSDAEFDQMLQKQLAKNGLLTPARALTKLGIEAEDIAVFEPILMQDYVPTMDTTDHNLARKGDDGKLRTSNYQVTWILCSKDQIFVFQCTFSLIEDDKKDNGEEYFFKDVTNITTVEVSDEIKIPAKDDKDKPQVIKVEKTKFRITIPGDKFECALDLTTEMQNKVRTIKNLLREKKA